MKVKLYVPVYVLIWLFSLTINVSLPLKYVFTIKRKLLMLLEGIFLLADDILFQAKLFKTNVTGKIINLKFTWKNTGTSML